MLRENIISFQAADHSLDFDKTSLFSQSIIEEETMEKCVNCISIKFDILHIGKYAIKEGLL